MSIKDYHARGCKQVPKPFNRNNAEFSRGCCKLDDFDWLANIEIPDQKGKTEFAEIRFKNSRKEYFRIPKDVTIAVSDIVAVESSPGHDIGIVTMLGETVILQMKKKNIKPESADVKRVYRRAKTTDIEKWVIAIDMETPTMYKTRKIANELDLDMKICDVEFQGDKTKAVFYYTADERVDFRELIKILAEEFMVRIEMRQIGVRQEASRVGGIGPCGRELCCSSWLTDFKSVSTNSARCQQLSLNPQKLAGQCSKLKCCLNYEYDCYLDAQKDFPNTDIVLKTKLGDAVHQKSDIFKRIMWYAYTNDIYNFIPISVDKVKEVIEMNKKNIIPEQLEAIIQEKEKEPDFKNAVGQDSLTRFDK